MNTKQCLSIEQMQHLKELGVDTSGGSAYWYRIVQHKCDGNIRVISDWKLTFSLDIAYCTGHALESMKTFTLQDILDLLPTSIKIDNKLYWLNFGKHVAWNVRYSRDNEELQYIVRYDLIGAAYEMLCWVIENGYLEKNKQ